MHNIKPSSELRNKYNEMSKICRETREPIYFTVNGHGDSVLLNIDCYNQLISELELLKMLADSSNDVLNNRIKPISTTFDEIRKKLGQQ